LVHAYHQNVAEGADRGTERGRSPAHEWRQNVTAVASGSVPVFDAVSMTAKTASHRVGKGTGWPLSSSLSLAKKPTPAQSMNSARYSWA
jgi:hypothetical protein